VLVPHEHVVPSGLASNPERQRRDRDLLLSDWGIHHLHLGTAPGRNPRFVRRTANVLLVAFRGYDAYLIALRLHESHGANWAARDILEVAARIWPDARIVERSNYAIGFTQEFGDDDRRLLRRSHVNLGIEIDGTVYMPSGQTGDGSPVAAARQAMKAIAVLNDLRDDDEWRERSLREATEQHGVPDRSWLPIVHEDAFGFVNGGVFVSFGRLVPDG
jgi:hypothetical protein